MIIDWFHFGFAILLLWLPRQALRLGKLVLRRRKRRFRDTNPATARQPGDPTVGFRTEFGKFRNYVDFLRAGLAGVALVGWEPGIAPAMDAGDNALPSTARLILALVILIMVIGVMIQALRFETKITLFAPIFYLGGLSIGLCGPTVAFFAFVLVWTINLALPNPTAFLTVYALLVGAFSLLFRGLSSEMPYVMAGLVFLPAFASLLIRRPLVVFTKKAKPPVAAA